MIIHSPGYKFRRGTGSPFDAMAVPGLDMGSHHGVPCQWCTHCKMSVDTRIEKYNQNQVWGMKQWCKRCGSVTQSAVYYHVASLDIAEGGTPLLDKAQAWSLAGETKG